MNFIDRLSPSKVASGFDYYKNKRVTNIKEISPGKFEAEVEGSEVYLVTIDMNNLSNQNLKCTCPDRAKKHLCKHIAATWFALNLEAATEYEQMLKRHIEFLKEMHKEYVQKEKEIKQHIKQEVDKMSIEQLKQEVMFYRFNEKIKYLNQNECYEEYEDEYYDLVGYDEEMEG